MYLEGAAPRPAGEDCNADGDGLCRRNTLDVTLRGPANPAFWPVIMIPSPVWKTIKPYNLQRPYHKQWASSYHIKTSHMCKNRYCLHYCEMFCYTKSTYFCSWAEVLHCL